MKKKITYKIKEINKFKLSLVNYLNTYKRFCFLDSNTLSKNNSFDFFCALCFNEKKSKYIENLTDLNKIIESKKWIFGHISYDQKNSIENLSSKNYDGISFPDVNFFVPDLLIKYSENKLSFLFDSLSVNYVKKIFFDICQTPPTLNGIQNLHVNRRVSKENYKENIKKIKEHLQNGDIYEMNYCQEFYIEKVEINPCNLFNHLNNESRAPFSALYRLDDKFCICASPERFLKKTGDKILSQPIKGTIKRSSNKEIDTNNKIKLKNSSKDFSENVMIVDLVRNDLSKVSKKSSVKVDELAKLYSYTNVHHLISTISCHFDKENNFQDLINATFPMGSMTGAPKLKSMELIEKFENSKRGLFSGSIGYISPDFDFDFNVVIRSILYNKKNKYLSFTTGGAITIESDPENEYQECYDKAKLIFKILGH